MQYSELEIFIAGKLCKNKKIGITKYIVFSQWINNHIRRRCCFNPVKIIKYKIFLTMKTSQIMVFTNTGFLGSHQL